MDRTTTKKNLKELLSNSAYSTIVLSGSWGAGKTHLWNEISKESDIKYLYYSLFGAKTANQIKRGLALSPTGVSEEEAQKAGGFFGKIAPVLSKALDGLADSKGLVGAAASAVGDLAGDAIIARVLKDSIIVLDDIERADPSLSIESIMGLIDELRRANNKVLIILSTQKLSESVTSRWAEFYEKCVDIELQLKITPEEAFSAIRDSLNNYVAETRTAWLETGCRNIRIAQRVSRAINTFFSVGAPPLS